MALYHPGSSDGLFALCLCLSVCFCALAITTQSSNAKSQPQRNVWLGIPAIRCLVSSIQPRNARQYVRK